MSAISSSFLPPSNRRRCVKGRPSYAEPIDFLLSSSANQEHNDDFSQNEYSFMDPVEPEEVEEDITIDLSAFLNENPLLAQSAFESAAENNVASTESSSQFRVTDCEIKPSEIPQPDGIDELGSVCVTGTNTENKNTVNDNIVPPALIDIVSTTCDSAKENCLSPEKIFTKVNNLPTNDITINGKKSPLKKFQKARPLGLSNPLKKYKNFMKSKDLNKVNEKFFGKYPVVKCEKLDIENLIKNNKIKVSNWPLLVKDNQNNKLVNKNNKKLGLPKTLKPKFMRKPISFNKSSQNSNKSQNNIHSILIDKLDTTSRPIIIKTDTWKPGIRNSNPVPAFFKNFISNPSATSKTAVHDLLKPNGNNQVISFNSSPEKQVEKPIFTHTNKIFNHTKMYQFIAPKLRTPDIVSHTPQYSKQTTESLIEPVADNYIVIEPYIEDPLVPQKSKPILTVPIEVLSSPEKLSPSTCPDIIVKDDNSESVENKSIVTKSVFPKKFSVFRSATDGAVRQLNFSPKNKDISVVAKKNVFAPRKLNRENILNRKNTNTYSAKEKAESSKEDSSILKAKNVVVDAMQSAFLSLQQKKKHKPVKKDYNSPYSSILSFDTSSYTSILNDNLLHGFTETDFEDVSLSTESNTSLTYDMLAPPKESPSKILNNLCKKRKSIHENSPYTSDTLSASECEIEKTDNKKSLVVKEASTKRRKKLSLSTSRLVHEPKTSQMLDTSVCVSNDIVLTEILNDQDDNKISLKHVDSSLSLSNIENPILKFSDDAKNDVHIPSENDKLEIHDTSVDEPPNIHSTPNKKKCAVLDNLPKQETYTRTLRERKSSSTEVDKTSENSVRQDPHNKNTVKKTKFNSIFAKLKIQMKTRRRSTAKVKIKRKSCSKPEDIIREINTITGGRVVSKVNMKKHKKQNSVMHKTSGSSDINIKEDAESNSLHFESNRHSPRSLPRRKALKIRIKKSKKKNSAPRLKLKLSSLPDAVENATSENSLSDSNINVHSSFREREVCSIGTLQTKGNSAESGREVSDCKMEAQEGKSTLEEPMPVNKEPTVKSSKYFEDASTSDLNNSVSNLPLLIKSNDDESLPNDSLIESEFILTDSQELDLNAEENSNILSPNISENVIDNTAKTSIPMLDSSNEVNGNAIASVEQLSIQDNEENTVISVSSIMHKPIEENFNSDNLLNETNGTSEKESDFEDVDHYEVNDISTDSNIFDNNLADTLNKIEDNIAKVSDVPHMKVSENCAIVTEEKLTLIKDSEIDESSTVRDEIHLDVSDNLKDTQVPHIEGPNSSPSEFKNFEVSNNVIDTDDRYLSSIEESKNFTSESVKIQEEVSDCCVDTKEKEAGLPCVRTPSIEESKNSTSESVKIQEEVSDCCVDMKEKEAGLPCVRTPSIEESKNSTSESVKIQEEVSDCCVDMKEKEAGLPCVRTPSIEESKNSTSESVKIQEEVSDCCVDMKEKEAGLPCVRTPSIEESKNSTSESVKIQEEVSDCCVDTKEKEAGLPCVRTPESSSESKEQSNSSDISESLNDVIKGDSLSLESPSSEKSSCSPRKEHITGERKARSKRQKKCPKIKISFKKHDGKSPESLKNWFVSESKKSDDSNDDVPEKDSENIISESLSPCNGVNSVPNTSQDTDESKIPATLSHDKQLSDLHEISLERMIEEKTDNSLSGDNSQVDTELTPKEKSAEENNSHEDDASKSNLDAKETVSSSSSDKNQLDSASKIASNDPAVENCFDPSIKIKEEPMDYDENLETSVGTIESALKKKRGRPRKSSIISAPKTSNKKINSRKEVKTSTPKPSLALNENKQLDDALAPEDIKPSISEIQLASTPHSGGRKKRITTPGSNASSNKKKNYDPELVVIPLLNGWSREHVIRSTDKQDKKQSDIYYHAPDGKKLRSMPEISTYLSKHTDMKLSTQHFTFAKELVYRPPFEHERYAHFRPAIQKTVTPNNKKTSNSPSNKSINVSKGSVKDSSDLHASTSGSSSKQNKPLHVKSSVSSSKKKTLKRRSSLKTIDVCKTENENSPVPPIKIKQERIDSYFVKENQTTRSSRKIIKKVPFDNSFENMFPKRPKQISKSHESSKSSKLKNVSDSLVSEKPKCSKEVIKENERLGGQCAEVSLPSTTNSCEIPVSRPIPENSSKSAYGQPIPERTKIQASLLKKMPKDKFKKHAQLLMAKPCTKFCNFASVLVPTIQCSICLCLFHRECIPFKPIGLTRYACVPCVGMRLTPSSAGEIVKTSDVDINVELFYPHIDLQIKTDLEFNATFNKFYSPVDPSFLTSQDNSNISQSQLPQNPGPQHTYYNWSNRTFNPPPRYNSRLPGNLCPVSFNPRNYRLIRAASQFQGAPGSNLNVYGTMPLQKFTNAYFVPNQSSNSVADNRPRNAPMFSTGKVAIPRYPNSSLTSNGSLPQGKNAVLYQVPRHNLLADKFLVLTHQNSNVQSGFIQGNASVLKTILQSVSGLAENSKVSSTSVLPEDSASAESAPKTGQLSDCVKQECNTLDTTDVASTSVLETDSLIKISNSEKSDSNKRTIEDEPNDDSRDKSAKKLKSDQSAEIKNLSNVSEHMQKNIVQKNRDSTTFWNINQFSQIYECLNLIFKYLSIPDLLRASLVCRSWNHLATQKLLWENACFSGISIKNWKKCCFTLQKYGTRCLDLRGINNQDSISVWESFSENIIKLCEVEELIFDKVPPFVINKIADTLPQLRRLICYCVTTVFTEPEIWSTPCEFELSTLRFLGRLEILKISSMGGINIINRQKSLMPYIPNLTHIVLTGFKFSSYMNLECLIQMQQLVTLELGDCMEIEPQIYGILVKLTTLQNLCLQNGGHINCKKMPDAISNMKMLKTLELMNFQTSAHLPNVLKKMDSLLHLSLWPDNRSEAAQVHFNSFEAALSCKNLKSLCWGILTDDDEQDDAVPSALELTDPSGKESRTLSAQELFQSLVAHYPRKKVELKSLPRSAWSEYCSSRSYV